MEAMASKVPVVCTNVGGIPEVIEDGINGFLVPVANSSTLAEKIIYLLKNKTLSNNFTLYGYHKIKQRFSLQSMLDKYAEIYSDLMTMN
ncbi:glycosyltransferase [Candidatus Desulfofervidus auxilii]|nr:glycosyltransferase family 4 protein [Candidatus Desulfofervidus auxilii]